MMHRLNIVAVCICFIVVSSFSATAAKRVALVVGNSAYVHAPHLKNPTNDAEDIGSVLRQLGFKVIIGRDLDKAGMEKTIRRFAAELDGAKLGLFFYAGHGLQVAGRNYLVPVDARATTSAALDFELIRLELVQRTMERATTTNVILLDACRDNPLTRNLARALGTRSATIGKGLAQIEAGVGTLISYATQPGNVALDGEDRNSPYSAALKKHLQTRGQDLTSVLIRVRNDVMAATANRQVPWDQHALRAKLFLADKSPSGRRQSGRQAPDEAATAWNATKGTTSIGVLTAFAKRYPDSVYADMATSRIKELQAGKAVASASSKPQSRVSTPSGGKKNETVIRFVRAKPGFLQVNRPNKNGHAVINAESRKILTVLRAKRNKVELPPGLYHVSFGSGHWKNVAVKSSRTTVLEPAVLEIKNASKSGHLVTDAKTGRAIELLRQSRPSSSLAPSVVNVRFDQTVWKGVVLSTGKRTVLNPGVFRIEGKIPPKKLLAVRDAKGKVAAYVRATRMVVPLPPGDYELDLEDDGKVPFTLGQGQSVKVQIEHR